MKDSVCTRFKLIPNQWEILFDNTNNYSEYHWVFRILSINNKKRLTWFYTFGENLIFLDIKVESSKMKIEIPRNLLYFFIGSLFFLNWFKINVIFYIINQPIFLVL